MTNKEIENLILAVIGARGEVEDKELIRIVQWAESIESDMAMLELVRDGVLLVTISPDWVSPTDDPNSKHILFKKV